MPKWSRLHNHHWMCHVTIYDRFNMQMICRCDVYQRCVGGAMPQPISHSHHLQTQPEDSEAMPVHTEQCVHMPWVDEGCPEWLLHSIFWLCYTEHRYLLFWRLRDTDDTADCRIQSQHINCPWSWATRNGQTPMDLVDVAARFWTCVSWHAVQICSGYMRCRCSRSFW